MIGRLGSATVPCTIMRGGTSKAVFLNEADIPLAGPGRDALVLRIFGSPDRRQIDGLGGGDPLTSKLAIIGPPTMDGCDIDYTFGQVEIEVSNVDYLSLCGNISAAVGLFAVQQGLVPPTEPVTRVVAHNTNLHRRISIEVPVVDGQAVLVGDYAIPGVPGTGARIVIDLADTAGASVGRLLPTGNPVDVLEVPGVGLIEASLVDLGNAHVFVRASDVGLLGTESAAEIDADADLLSRLERIRGAGAVRMGMAKDVLDARSSTPATPIIGVIAASAAYQTPEGIGVALTDVDVVSRLQFMQRTHKTHAGTSTACMGAAARIPGTLVAQLTDPSVSRRQSIRIGHPAGVIETESVAVGEGADVRVTRATLGRTARRILDGVVYV